MTRTRSARLALVAALVAAGCSDHEFHPPDREEQVARADTLYSPALFDTVSWASRAERIQSGNLVYADECRRCHGPVGRGDTEYARSRGLDAPSLVAPEWEDGDDHESVRRRVFTGHPAGMPTWGIGRLTPRQVDAVSYYVTEQLRPEIIGSAVPDG